MGSFFTNVLVSRLLVFTDAKENTSIHGITPIKVNEETK